MWIGAYAKSRIRSEMEQKERKEKRGEERRAEEWSGYDIVQCTMMSFYRYD